MHRKLQTIGIVAAALCAATSYPGNATTNSYAAAYRAVKWGPNVRVSFSDCTMTFDSTGAPTYHADYYLAPSGPGSIVARTPVTDMPLHVIPYHGSNVAPGSATITTCPTKAANTTPTNMGPIGYTIAGEAIFNAYEASGEAALGDNASYAFTSKGRAETASFIDACNSHAAGMRRSALWHHHGVPSCLTAQLDGNGPSHILGFALDGFPIYGGRDINGKVIGVSQLDACNGITSPTPEFPQGAYHYVLPIGVTDRRSSLDCYAGTPTR